MNKNICWRYQRHHLLECMSARSNFEESSHLNFAICSLWFEDMGSSTTLLRLFSASLFSISFFRSFPWNFFYFCFLKSICLCLVVGTSSVVYPAAMFAPQVTKIEMHTILMIGFSLKVASRGVPVAEFNMETTPATRRLGGHGFFFQVQLTWFWFLSITHFQTQHQSIFQGPCGTTLPPALAPWVICQNWFSYVIFSAHFLWYV